jgi:transposase
MQLISRTTDLSLYRVLPRAADPAARVVELTDEMWARISACLPPSEPQLKAGRRRAPDRPCFEGILWLIWTDASWNALPGAYGSASTCRRRFKDWHHDGSFLKMWCAYVAGIDDVLRRQWQQRLTRSRLLSRMNG